MTTHWIKAAADEIAGRLAPDHGALDGLGLDTAGDVMAIIRKHAPTADIAGLRGITEDDVRAWIRGAEARHAKRVDDLRAAYEACPVSGVTFTEDQRLEIESALTWLELEEVVRRAVEAEWEELWV